MHEGVLKRFKAAICSLSESTAVQLTAEGVVAHVSGRCSPYKSHRTVTYDWVDREVSWSAVNGRYQLIIRCPEQPELPPQRVSHPLHRVEWERETLPRPLLEPLLQEFERWVGVKFPDFPSIVACAMPMPQLACFVNQKPAFWFLHADWTEHESVQGAGWRAYRAGGETPDCCPVVVPPAQVCGLQIRTAGQPCSTTYEPHGWYGCPWWLITVGRPDVDVLSQSGSATSLPEGRWWITVDSE